jgi:hypothetical protein
VLASADLYISRPCLPKDISGWLLVVDAASATSAPRVELRYWTRDRSQRGGIVNSRPLRRGSMTASST